MGAVHRLTSCLWLACWNCRDAKPSSARDQREAAKFQALSMFQVQLTIFDHEGNRASSHEKDVLIGQLGGSC